MKGCRYILLLQLLLFGCRSNITYNFNADGVYGAFFNERNEFVYAGLGNGHLVMYDSDLTELDRVQLAPGPVSTCITSPDGNYLVNTSADGKLYIWGVSGSRFDPYFEETLHTSASWTCLFSPGQRYVVSTGADSTIVILEWPSLDVLNRIRSGSGAIRFAWFTADESVLLWVTEGGYLVRRAFGTGRTDSVQVAESPLNCVVSDKHGRHILAAADNGSFYVLSYADLSLVQEISAHEGAAYVAEFWDPDHRRISTCGADGMVTTWMLAEDGTRYVADGSVRAHSGVSCTLYYNAAGDKLLSGGQDGWVRIWDARSLQLLDEVHTHQ